jgi:hypothetical protein
MQTDKFVMRSQLDCQDNRLPGTGVFDIKTRACISLRMDILNYEVAPASYFIGTLCANYWLPTGKCRLFD